MFFASLITLLMSVLLYSKLTMEGLVMCVFYAIELPETLKEYLNQVQQAVKEKSKSGAFSFDTLSRFFQKSKKPVIAPLILYRIF